jgi:glutamyl-tRNA synthetase
MEEDILLLIRKYAIKNAVDYNGKASFGSVFSKAISKVGKGSNLEELKTAVSNVVKDINGLTPEQQMSEFKKYESEFEEEYKEKLKKTANPNLELQGAEVGNFATRYAPEPNGYLHLGHAKVVFLEQEQAKIYKGKAFLYFDDTNPEKERQEFVDSIKMDLEWLGAKFDKEYYASDNIEKEYEYARKLIEINKAYVCTCEPETIKKYRFESIECPHSHNPESENMVMFQEMLDGEYDEGKAVLRFKGDIASQNTAMRDPTLMRIKNSTHYRQGDKYLVWPTYDFNTPIMDSIHGVTDAMRSKEYELRDTLYKELLHLLGLRVPRMHYEARLEIKGTVTSKRKLNELINKGLVSGYDDPRLITIAALRRRGILPEAIKKFVLRFGMSLAGSTTDISYLMAENKRLVDPSAKRLFFVENPIRLELEGFANRKVKMALHPNGNLGEREYEVGNVFYISSPDAEGLDVGSEVRLKDLIGVKVSSISKSAIHGSAIEDQGNKDMKKVQWVSEGNYVKCNVLVPGEMVDKDDNFIDGSLKTSSGYVESYADKLQEREVIQFERFGFATFDGNEKGTKRFIFMSK